MKRREKKAKREVGGGVKGRRNRNEKKLGEFGAGYSESPAFASPGPLDVFPGIQWFPGAF